VAAAAFKANRVNNTFDNIKTQITVYVEPVETAGSSKATLKFFSCGRIYARWSNSPRHCSREQYHVNLTWHSSREQCLNCLLDHVRPVNFFFKLCFTQKTSV